MHITGKYRSTPERRASKLIKMVTVRDERSEETLRMYQRGYDIVSSAIAYKWKLTEHNRLYLVCYWNRATLWMK